STKIKTREYPNTILVDSIHNSREIVVAIVAYRSIILPIGILSNGRQRILFRIGPAKDALFRLPISVWRDVCGAAKRHHGTRMVCWNASARGIETNPIPLTNVVATNGSDREFVGHIVTGQKAFSHW